MYDPGKDFVRQHEQQMRRQAQERMDTSGRPWEHQDSRLLRRFRNPLRQFLILIGIVAVLLIVLMVLSGLSGPPEGI